MPLPIWPAPMMPIVSILPVICRSRRRALKPARHVAVQIKWAECLRPPRPLHISASLPLKSKSLFELRQDLEEVADKTIVGDLEDRRLLVLVDGDDHLGVLHAGQMLDRAGDADRDIKFRGHHLAGLADLPVVRRIAGIDRGARGADAGA